MSTERESKADLKAPPRILLAEDDKEMRALLARALRKDGYDVTECSHGINLAGRLSSFFNPNETERVDLIVSDIRMPGLSGIEVLEGLSTHPDSPPMILITAFGDEATHQYVRRLGAVAIFDKPFSVGRLLAKVHEVVPMAGLAGGPDTPYRENGTLH